MSDIKLFRVEDSGVKELQGQSVAVEKSLQTLIEKHLESFLGVRFLKSEYPTGLTHGGRIDTLGLDEDNSPVIIEYKRSLNENVINQGLFYLDWLLDHQGEFELLVQKTIGQETAGKIDWSATRLLCIAGDFTKYDEHAVNQINRNIELIRYKKFGEGLILFELVNAVSVQAPSSKGTQGQVIYKTVSELLNQANPELKDLFEDLKAFLLSLGDDVQMKTLKFYFAFKRLQNFACAEIYPKARKIHVYVKLNPDKVNLQKGFLRDVRGIGHFGTGDLEITIKSREDLKRAEPLLIQSYEGS